MEGKMVMEVNPQVSNAILERLLGGQGATTIRNGALTEIESILLKKIFSQAANLYQDAWENIENIQVRWKEIETNSQFIQIASQNDTVIIIVLHITIGETSGRMTLCLPHLIVEQVLPKLSAHQWLSSMTKTKLPQDDILAKNLDTVRLPVIAELGRATLQVSDLLNLQNGDVIGIETGKLQVKVGHLTRFFANPGLQKGKYAVQIEEVIQTEGDDQLT
jgi:flagellar motor switch protein FliM